MDRTGVSVRGRFRICAEALWLLHHPISLVLTIITAKLSSVLLETRKDIWRSWCHHFATINNALVA
jgi:hypothetical protein